MKSSLTHTLKQPKDVENKWNIPFGTEDCRVKSSAGKEAESSVNLLMLQYLPISLFQSITPVCPWKLMAGSTTYLSHNLRFGLWNKEVSVQLHLPHSSSHI